MYPTAKSPYPFKMERLAFDKKDVIEISVFIVLLTLQGQSWKQVNLVENFCKH